MEGLKQQIKEKKFNNIMLFFGEETFMLDYYVKKIVEVIIGDGEKTMNHDVFDDRKTVFSNIEDSMDTMPFFSDSRVIILKNLGLFEKTGTNLAGLLAEKLNQLQSTTYVILIEQTIDKRTKLYKSIHKNGYICEFPLLGESELIRYIAKTLNPYGKKIEQKEARYLIHYVGDQLTVLHNEINKLIHYIGDSEVVTHEAIEAICQKSVESKIFELVDCMGTKKRARALKLYHDLLSAKEPSNRILFMLTRQFRMVYKCKLLLGEGLDSNDIGKKLKIQSFVARKCLEQGKTFSLTALEEALKKCLECEIDIRTGVFMPDLAVEQLIIRYSGI
ncbi:DNA polymerase III subunit delta [Petrocella sp. FN5]|uniref:DNA polymerase III subunit delta n=1 Tax=Petrocella sp. FN5 TaxID=3032002 RepID=UPI0023DB84F2|nr:DNA polymerase III subunit delta [Petrocella sp. FN5]MDF1616573.1 DNA polymerase III subunit delta [Petrocella sp. FN5]